MKRSKRSGAAAAELAMWLPFLGFMFVVAMDYCRIFYSTQVLQSCAATAALYASGHAEPSEETEGREQAAREAAVAEGVSLKPPLKSENVQIAGTANEVTVTVKHDFSRLVPWPGQAEKVSLTRTCKMGFAPKLPGQ
jgi:Flp pilus assembly protein TadG